MDNELDANQQVITGIATYDTKELSNMVRESGPKSFKESLTDLLDIPVDKTAMSEMLEAFGASGLTPQSPTMSDFLAAGMIAKAAMGDTKAFEVVRDTVGQKPVDRVEQDRVVRVMMDPNIKKYGE